MTPSESFAAACGISPEDVTHCVRIGIRMDADVYAFDYWDAYSYTSGIIERYGEEWGGMRYGQDMDIERLTAPTAEATQSKMP